MNEGRWEGGLRGEDICTPIADSLHCAVETKHNILKQLSPSLEKKKKRAQIGAKCSGEGEESLQQPSERFLYVTLTSRQYFFLLQG